MGRALKILLVLVAVVVGIGLLVPYVVNVDRYRPQIEAEVLKHTGRRLEIGVLRARALPTIGFVLEKVTLGSPAGFADVNLLSAEAIKGSLAFFPLLHGNVEVTSVDIEKPVLILATDEHGKTNYDFSSPQARVKPAAYHPAETAGGPAIVLDSVSISGGSMCMVDVRGHKPQPPAVELSGLNANFSHVDLSPQGIADLEGSVPLSGVKVEVAGAPPVSFRSGKIMLDNGAANGSCEAEIPQVGRVKGDFSIPSLQKLLASSPGGHGDALASGKFSTDKLSFAPYEITGVTATPRMFRDHIEAPITGAAYGGTVNVHARLDSSAAPSRLSANIQIAQVDLQKLMAANPSPRGTMTGHGELKLQVAAPLGGNLERSMTGQGSFALKDGKLPGMQLAKSMKELSEVERLLSLGQSGVPAVSETTYTLIGGDLEIRGARIYTNKTHLETNVGSGDMNGSVGFDQTLDLGGTWNLPKGSRAGAATAGAVGATVLTGGLLAPALFGASGAMLRIPFSVKGTLKDPKIGPGGGSSGSKGGDSQQAAGQQQQQPQQKKKILGLVPKP